MAQMTKCPQCGADNSIRRVTCYACDAPLAQHTGAADRAPADRFAAVIRERLRAPSEQPAAESASASAASLPRAYGSTLQAWRAMLLFRQLHTLVGSGIPLAQALTDLAGRVPRRTRRAVQGLAQHVTAGGRLSDAMRGHPELFLAYQAGLVQAGETGGELPRAVDTIARDCEAEFEVRKAVALALLPVYVLLPVLTLVAPLALVLRTPPPPQGWSPAELATDYSRALGRVLLVVAAAVGAIWGTRAGGVRSPALRGLTHRISLALPLVGGASRRLAMMRFLGSLAMLLKAGVPVADAYRTAAEASGNLAFSRKLLRDADDLYVGRGLSETMGRLGVLPKQVLDQMVIGETAGKLPEVLERIALDERRGNERFLKYLPRLVQLVAYAIVVPVVFLVVYSLWTSFWELRLFAPLRAFEEGP